jgi:hypothetical protein
LYKSITNTFLLTLGLKVWNFVLNDKSSSIYVGRSISKKAGHVIKRRHLEISRNFPVALTAENAVMSDDNDVKNLTLLINQVPAKKQNSE